MAKILFWNIGRKPITEQIARLSRLHDPDVLFFAESEIPDRDLCEELNRGAASLYASAPGRACERIQTFSRIPLIPVRETPWMTIRRMPLDRDYEILVTIVHLRSKMNMRNESQQQMCGSVAREIIGAEDQVGHSRTCLLGDLNMNPFEAGVAGAEGLHAVMSRRTAAMGSRKVMGKNYRFFYNPMWGHFGDSSSLSDADHAARPPGTYFKRMAEHVSYDWNMFDQVMIRPELLPRFATNSVRILTDDGVLSFLTPAGQPNTRVTSDHLPITFELR